MRTDLELAFADGTYQFRLTLAGIGELQEKTSIGLGGLFARLLAGRYIDDSPAGTFGMPTEAQWHVRDLTETIRLALIGGGHGTTHDGQAVAVSPGVALKLVQDYVFPAQPLRDAWTLATAILTACVEGWDDREHEIKKKRVRPKRTGAGSTSRSRSGRSRASELTPSPEVASPSESMTE